MKNVELYKEYHKIVPDYGAGSIMLVHIDQLVGLIRETKCRSLLDFGCGKGTQYSINNIHQRWDGLRPDLYDPAIPEHDKLPDKTYDGVFSIDVMEHIPEEECLETLQLMFDRAERFVFLGISTRPAQAILPNGENAHCTVKSPDWWEEKILDANTNSVYTHMRTYGNWDDYRIYNEEQHTNWLWQNWHE
jgi:hypothetical protein